MYSDHVHYIIRDHWSMLQLQQPKVVFNVPAPLKILIDSVFNNSAISLSSGSR